MNWGGAMVVGVYPLGRTSTNYTLSASVNNCEITGAEDGIPLSRNDQ